MRQLFVAEVAARGPLPAGACRQLGNCLPEEHRRVPGPWPVLREGRMAAAKGAQAGDGGCPPGHVHSFMRGDRDG